MCLTLVPFFRLRLTDPSARYLIFVSFSLFDPFWWTRGCETICCFSISLSITFCPFVRCREVQFIFIDWRKWRMTIRGIDGWGRQSVILQLLFLCVSICGGARVSFLYLSLPVVVTPIKRNGRDSVMVVVVQLFLFIFFFFIVWVVIYRQLLTLLLPIGLVSPYETKQKRES